MTMEHTAPYGFVPLSRFVFTPEWADLASSDHPFEDGICGRLEVEIEALAPIFTRGAERERFFTLPDGRFAIPGSTVRGLLRNTLEIATFGWMSRVNDHRYGVRDLRNPSLYVRHMADVLESASGVREPMPLVSAGWLQRTPDFERWEAGELDDEAVVAQIVPCNFAKVEYDHLKALARERGIGNFDPGRRQSAVAKYGAWKASLEAEFEVQPIRKASALPGKLEAAYREKRFGEYGRAVPGQQRAIRGTLVFTGQPSKYSAQNSRRRGSGNPKHHDFFFHALEGAQPIEVKARLFRDFEFVHSDRGEQHSLNRSDTPNKEWKFWREKFEGKNGRVPVFYLLDQATGELRAFGLAMMFRLAYRFSVRDSVRNVQELAFEPVGRSGRKPDLVETLFGYAGERKGEASAQALRGRVGVGTFVAATPAPREWPENVRVVLAAPKASYYPNYIEQGPEQHPGARPQGEYKTFMDEDAVIRGWKRYRVLDKVVTPPIPRDASGKELDIVRVGTTFRPLAPGVKFTGEIRVHNVKPEELGAIVWALDFGGERGCEHLLGLANALGYGRVRLRLIASDCRNMRGEVVEPRSCVAGFVKAMEEACRKGQVPGGWRNSPQVTELLNLARPVPVEKARPFVLDSSQRKNEFEEAKREKSALPSVTDWNTWRQRTGARPAMPRPGRSAGACPPSQGQPPPASRPVQHGPAASGNGSADPHPRAPRDQAPGAPAPQAPKPVNKGQYRKARLRRAENGALAVIVELGRDARITNPSRIPAQLSDGAWIEVYIEAANKAEILARFEKALT